MGYNTALDLAESFDLDQAILIHLQNNHYPLRTRIYGTTMY